MSIVVGNMIGSGVFLLPASLAPYRGLSLAGWVISAGGSVMLALVFARLARADPAAGGPYAFTRRAFGDLPGFLVGWGYWISVWCSNAALAVAFVGYLDPFIPSIVRTPASAALLAIATVWFLTLVNARGVVAAGRVQVVTTTLKLLPLAVVAIVGLAMFEPAHFTVVAPTASAAGADLLAVVTLTLWAFLGLETATVPAGAVRDPDRTIPRATIVGTLIAAGIYIASTVGVMSVVPPDVLATSTAPFADAARSFAGDWAGRAVALGGAVSCFGALNGWILIVGQLPLAIARDGLFPKPMARLSSRGTPVVAMTIGGVLSSALIWMNYSQGLVTIFTKFILLSTLSTLVPYAYCSLAGFLMKRRDGGKLELGRSGTIISVLAFTYALVAIGGAGADVIYWGFLLLTAGLPVYVWVVRGARQEART